MSININNNESGSAPVRKDSFKVGDTAYIIESNRFIREVTIVKRSNSFCTVRFADSLGAIFIREGRLYGTREQAEEKLPKKKTSKPKFEGPRPPHRIW